MTGSAERARQRWDEIRAGQDALLGDRALVVAATSYRDQPVWAVRTGPFASAHEAEGFCVRLQAAGQDCWAMVPTRDPSAREIALSSSVTAAPAPIAPAPVAAATEPAVAPPAVVPGRQAFAQLAASDSEHAALGEWERLRRRFGPLLRDRQEITVAAEVSGRTVWRLRTGPFQLPREAEAFCAEVRSAGGACWAAAGS
jgi:hypothetical protein